MKEEEREGEGAVANAALPIVPVLSPGVVKVTVTLGVVEERMKMTLKTVQSSF